MVNIYLARVWDDPAMDQKLTQPHASNSKTILAPLYIAREYLCRRILHPVPVKTDKNLRLMGKALKI